MQKTPQIGIHRGLSTYCFYPLLNVNMDLEDCFQIMYDMGAHGLEILADGIIDGYPFPSQEWINKFFALCDRYEIIPVEYGHWVESRTYRGRELTVDESLEKLVHDIKLASYLGFTCMRTKLGVIDNNLTPTPIWREFIRKALPYAEKYNVIMQPEIHVPTRLTDPMIYDYVEFIEKEQTPYFGFNIDFSVFGFQSVQRDENNERKACRPEEMIPLLPYVHCCHAKYIEVSEEFEETTIPYREIIKVMQDHNWSGYLLSEFESKYHEELDLDYCITQVKRQHIMLKRLLGE